MHFELALEDGQLIDSTFDSRPGVFVFGDGTLPEGFESLIRGMQAGEQKSFRVPPEKAFGMRNPNNLQTFSRSHFDQLGATVLPDDSEPAQDGEDAVLRPGMVLSFADAAKAEVPGVVSEVRDEEVVIDFNHPLAGQTLQFRVDILHIEAEGSSGQTLN
ncbi:FKBP-type peptidyl-prolyl cis-trans isomerase [Allohahella marinimesophila]|uniref:Peptidyl-prolyl cis-trans isomerase n=2 Tax=Allohahella marinimesophila TaxID=1054972 RepID=A0ABP7PT86_9GAMM